MPLPPHHPGGISWTICKSFAPYYRQITMPAPHHSVLFTDWMLFLMPNKHCQSTEGKTLPNALQCCYVMCKQPEDNMLSECMKLLLSFGIAISMPVCLCMSNFYLYCKSHSAPLSRFIKEFGAI